jgi:hypothetical protein
MAKLSNPLAQSMIDLGQYMGVRVRPDPLLAHGRWGLDDHGCIVVAHDLWQELQLPVDDPELILPCDEEISTPDEHSTD